MALGNLITTTAASISSGGTINGNLTIEGDLTVNGDGSGNYDEIVNGNMTISSTNKLVLGGDGSDTYLQESGADVLDIYVGGANMIKLTESTTDTMTVTGALTIGSDGSGHDVTFYSDTAGDSFVWDSSAEKLTITGTDGQTALDIADGNLVVADNIDLEGDIDVNGTANLDNTDIDGTLTVAGGISTFSRADSSPSGTDPHGIFNDAVFGSTDTANTGITIFGSGQTSLAFGDAGDSDIGQIRYQHASDKLEFLSNADVRMVIDSSGNVGIGTTSPSFVLEASGSTDILQLIGTGTGGPQLRMTDTSDSADGDNFGYVDFSAKDSNNNQQIFNRITNVIVDDTDGTEDTRQTFATYKAGTLTETLSIVSGNVGIGTTAPRSAQGYSGSILEIGSADDVALVLTSDDGEGGENMWEIGNNTSGRLEFVHSVAGDGSTGTKMVIDSSGNVGIGTTSPIGLVEINSSTTPELVFNDTGGGSDSKVFRLSGGGDKFFFEGRNDANSGDGDAPILQTFDLTNGNVGFGTASPAYALDILNSTTPQLNISNTASDNTAKYSQVTCSHYHNSEEPVTMIEGRSDGSNNYVRLGGGRSEGNSVNFIEFYAGANDATTAGSMILKLGADSRVYTSTGSGTANTVFGHQAGNLLASGDNYNTFIGHQVADADMTDATANVGIGHEALGALTEGDSNVAIGFHAGLAITTGDSNIIIGQQAGDAMQAVSNCIVIGHDAVSASNDTDANGTVAIGHSALAALTSGQQNVAIGYQALDAAETTDFNVAVGSYALSGVTGAGSKGYNTAVGDMAGETFSGDDSAYNTLVGARAGKLGTTGYTNNTVVGAFALDRCTTNASHNVAIGYAAMHGDFGANDVQHCVAIGGGDCLSGTLESTASGTVAIGHQAGMQLTSGSGNIAIGKDALNEQTDGASNTVIGYQAMKVADGGERGNTAVGYQALVALDSSAADENTCIGNLAGDSLVSGGDNTIIGSEADGSGSTASNQIVIGKSATGQADDSVTLGNNSVDHVYMAQDKKAQIHASYANWYPLSSYEGADQIITNWTGHIDDIDASNQMRISFTIPNVSGTGNRNFFFAEMYVNAQFYHADFPQLNGTYFVRVAGAYNSQSGISTTILHTASTTGDWTAITTGNVAVNASADTLITIDFDNPGGANYDYAATVTTAHHCTGIALSEV